MKSEYIQMYHGEDKLTIGLIKHQLLLQIVLLIFLPTRSSIYKKVQVDNHQEMAQ